MFRCRMPYITTTDNPFNPFTEFEKWQEVDIKNGYYTRYTLQEEATHAEKYLQIKTDRYWVDYDKAIIIAMMNMVYQDEKQKRTLLKQILPRNVHYRIVWGEHEPE